eukprot:662950-Pleurochrysis_carterae.AAC.1
MTVGWNARNVQAAALAFRKKASGRRAKSGRISADAKRHPKHAYAPPYARVIWVRRRACEMKHCAF